MESIRRISTEIDRVVDRIPPRFYIGGDENWKSITGLNDSVPTTEVLKRLAAVKAKKKNSVKKANAKVLPNNPASNDLSTKGNVDLREKLRLKIEAARKERIEKQRKHDIAMREQREKQTIKKGAPSQANPAASINKSSSKKPDEDPEIDEDIDFGVVKTEKKKIDAAYIEPKKGQKMKALEKEVRDQTRHEKKLNALEEDERLAVIHEEKMDKALRRANNEKIRDNVTKLKKTQKQLEKKKDKNREKWSDRMADKKKKSVKKQENREEHLKRKMKKGGRVGFEGSGGGSVINKDKDV